MLLLCPSQIRVLAASGDFVACGPAGSLTSTGTGIYVLLMQPATGFAELAPRVGLNDGGRSSNV